MRKPNYSMERKDRERAKQAKAAEKAEKRAAAKGTDGRPADETQDLVHPGDAESAKSDK